MNENMSFRLWCAQRLGVRCLGLFFIRISSSVDNCSEDRVRTTRVRTDNER
jgi:hypothetical protein